MVFVDLETTGLSPAQGDRIVEIGIVVQHHGESRTVSQLVNPLRCIPPEAQQIHGIADADVARSPTFADVADRVGQSLNRAWVIGHNIRFDAGFLAMEFALTGGAVEPLGCLDTCQLARSLFNLPDYQLRTVVALLGLERSGWHRALDDAEASKLIFDRVVAELGGPKRVRIQELQALHKSLPVWPPQPSRTLPRPLYDALTSGQPINIQYINGDGKHSTRRIVPQACFPAGRHVYIRAYCNRSAEMRTFRFDRIVEIAACV